VPGALLAVEWQRRGRTTVLRLCGELRDISIRALEDQIDRLACTAGDAVLLDLKDLTALDDVGVQVLVGLHHYMRGRRGSLRAVGADPQIIRVLAGTPFADRPVRPQA
jgi:anti-anti-sigma factor